MADIHDITITFNNLDDHLNDEEREEIIQLITNFCLKVSRQDEAERIELSLNEQKNHTGEVTVFQLTSQLFFQSGDKIVAHAGGRELEPALREVLKRLEIQEHKKH